MRGVTVGNFDGFHIGHQELFGTLKDELAKLAQNREQELLLVTFHPHPRAFFKRFKEKGFVFLKPLMTLKEKLQLAGSYGFSYFLSLRFSQSLSMLSPEDFFEIIFRDYLRADLIVVGSDWRFGRDRAGDVTLLKKLGERFGVKVISVADIALDGKRVSSSVVRELVSQGKVKDLSSHLGRNYTIDGRIISGDRRGQTLGFPTANLIPGNVMLPMRGVYATWSYVGAEKYFSVTNIGVRPTFGGGKRDIVESHFFMNSNEAPVPKSLNIYGKRLRVEFVERIRGERKFSGKDELVRAIVDDRERAREILRKD